MGRLTSQIAIDRITDYQGKGLTAQFSNMKADMLACNLKDARTVCNGNAFRPPDSSVMLKLAC